MKTIWIAQAHASQRDVIRLIKEDLGGAVTVHASHKQDREEILMQADAWFLEPVPEGEGRRQAFLAWALAKAVETRADLMLAMRYARPLAANAAAFAALGTRVCCGSTDVESLDVAEHKDRFTSLMLRHGIPVAETILVHDEAAMRAAIATLSARHEVCVKPAVGVYGNGFWRLSPDASPMDAYLATEDRLARTDDFLRAYAARPSPFLVMEMLPGVEHSVDCVCVDGEMIAAAARRKEGSHQVVQTGGMPVEIARRVARLLRLDGIVNVQTRDATDGQPRVLEVNTRPSGGVGYSAAAGVNLPAIWARHHLGLPYQVPHLPFPAVVRTVDQTVALPRATAALNPTQVAAA